jgi:acyl-coenzyme A thioesterase PaaI-like protein
LAERAVAESDDLRQLFAEAVPFNRHLGIELVELGRGEARAVPPSGSSAGEPSETQHAAGLFAVAEGASGAAMLGLFAERVTEVIPLAREQR